MDDQEEPPSLDVLEPFGWVFTPGPPSAGSISAQEARVAAESDAYGGHGTAVSVRSGTYTEKGRYRVDDEGRRVTLYEEHPVWVVSFEQAEEPHTGGDRPKPRQYSRHVVLDGFTGKRLTAFMALPEPGAVNLLDLHEPLDAPDMTRDEALKQSMDGERDQLVSLPATTEYGSRWRLVPAFVQVTDVWRVTFDTSDLPSPPDSPREIAWVVIVDDKAGHRWLSAAVQAGGEASE
ncbi:MAG TPA: hypothetical protein VF221_22480 [Chloroflexota bacterium]